MALGDTQAQSYPNNSHKQDWAYYPFIGGRGGGGGQLIGLTRYSFWVDFDPFDVKNLKMLSENVGFQIFNDVDLDVPLIPLFIIDQSNDITDELIEKYAPTKQGQTTSIGTASITYPPYGYLDDGLFSSSGAGDPPTSSSLPAVGSAAAGITNGTSTGLTIGQRYYYCITAVNSSSVESLPSAVVSATPTAQFPTIAVTFDSNVPGALYYNIYRNTTGVFNTGNDLYQSYYYPGQPPYYSNTTFTSQPANRSFRNDQGSYTINAFKGNGVAFGQGNMVGQGFVPQQAELTAFTFAEIFRSDIPDHTTFQNVIFELWDSNNTFYKHLGTLSPIFNPTKSTYTATTPAGLTLTDGNVPYCNTITYDTQDDGLIRWTALSQFQIQFTSPISVTPGLTYYIVCRTAVQTGTGYYALGGNYDNTVTRDPLYYYPFASAIQAVDGSSTFSNLTDTNGKQITFPFLTLGNVGRYAVTYWWANIGNGANNYWTQPPNANEYLFLHIDYISRI